MISLGKAGRIGRRIGIGPCHPKADLVSPAALEDRIRAFILHGYVFQVSWFAALATGIVLATTGFEFGVSNNVHHVPYVLRLDTLPQFANDDYLQSLRNYTSIVWLAMRQVATRENVYSLFLGSYVTTLLLYFFALLHITARMVSGDWKPQLLASLLFATSYLDSGYSTPGGHDLISGYFTHSELATPIALFALCLALQQRFIAAVALSGMVFDINAFVAVWVGVALASISLWRLRHGMSLRKLARDWLYGSVAASIIAMPVLFWIAHSLHSGGQFDGDFAAYLLLMFPNHFLITSASQNQLVVFASSAVLGVCTLSVLGEEGGGWRAALLGFLAVFAMGCVLPYVSHERLLFELHLLRVDGFVQIIATFGTVSLIARDLNDHRWAPLAMAMAACVLLSRYLLPFAAMLAVIRLYSSTPPNVLSRQSSAQPLMWFLSREPRRSGERTWSWRVILVLVAIAGTIRLIRPLNWLEPEPQRNPQFVELTTWAREATDPFSVYMLNGERFSILDKFSMWSERRSWFDMRQGIAVLWDPKFYRTWRPRYDILHRQHSPDERLNFACRIDVDYYVDEQVPGFSLQQPVADAVAFQNAQFFAIDARRYCRSQK